MNNKQLRWSYNQGLVSPWICQKERMMIDIVPPPLQGKKVASIKYYNVWL